MLHVTHHACCFMHVACTCTCMCSVLHHACCMHMHVHVHAHEREAARIEAVQDACATLRPPLYLPGAARPVAHECDACCA